MQHDALSSAGALTWPAHTRRAQLLQVAADVADAMAYLHLPPAVVTHRDLKSSNVLLDGNGRAVVCGMRPAELALCSCSSAAAC